MVGLRLGPAAAPLGRHAIEGTAEGEIEGLHVRKAAFERNGQDFRRLRRRQEIERAQEANLRDEIAETAAGLVAEEAREIARRDAVGGGNLLRLIGLAELRRMKVAAFCRWTLSLRWS